MGRTIRHSSTGWYHVMNRGVASQPIVDDDADRRKFIEVLAQAVDDSPATVHAYCVMTNHYHLLVEADSAALGQFMKRLGQRYSQAFNRRYDRIGPIFAGRYHHVPIETDAQLLATIRYIALNPAAIDRYSIDRYRWSSHGAIVQNEAPRWLSDAVVDLFGGVDEYRRFVAFGRSEAEQIVEVARLATDELLGLRSARDRDTRDVVLLLAEAVDASLARELVDELGFANSNNERTARHRARRRSSELAAVVERVRFVLGYSTDVAVPGSGDRR